MSKRRYKEYLRNDAALIPLFQGLPVGEMKNMENLRMKETMTMIILQQQVIQVKMRQLWSLTILIKWRR
jgi:hypothetical protein